MPNDQSFSDELIDNYEVGQTLRLRCAITDPDTGSYVDPLGIAVTVKSPSGLRIFPAAIQEDTGRYAALVTPAESGMWSYRFQGGDAIVAVNEGRFFVRKSSV